jgi:hypothetical protein
MNVDGRFSDRRGRHVSTPCQEGAKQADNIQS